MRNLLALLFCTVSISVIGQTPSNAQGIPREGERPYGPVCSFPSPPSPYVDSAGYSKSYIASSASVPSSLLCRPVARPDYHVYDDQRSKKVRSKYCSDRFWELNQKRTLNFPDYPSSSPYTRSQQYNSNSINPYASNPNPYNTSYTSSYTSNLYNSKPANPALDPLSIGQIKFQQGNYAEALQILEKGHFDSKQAAEAHYYKGCCLSKLGRDTEAEREFKLAKLLDKSGKVAPLAKQALENATKSQQAASTAPARTTGDPAEIKRCAQRILSQSRERIGRVWSDDYRPRASRLDEYTPLTTSPTKPRRFCGTGPTYIPGISPGSFDQNRYRYHAYQQNSYTQDPQTMYLQKKAGNVAQSAEGLLNLLTRKDDGTGVFLVPEGTNLYVRNYEYGASIDPPPPQGLKADVPMLALPVADKKIDEKKKGI